MDRVFLDTNAVFPASVLDLLLRLAEIELHTVLWSEEMLAEFEAKVVEKGRKTSEQARHITDCIRRAFPDGEVLKEDYGHLVDQMTGPDPDDHMITAAAAAGNATVIVSGDKTGFPTEDLDPHGLARKSADDYLVEVFTAYPDEVLDVLREQADDKRRPPMTVSDVLAALERAGCSKFVNLVREHLGGGVFPVP